MRCKGAGKFVRRPWLEIQLLVVMNRSQIQAAVERNLPNVAYFASLLRRIQVGA
jgi:hypothetical protein